ncbi:MAG: phosphopantothenoylcysteine decarboxylase/phosphopantothenate--cysteine ligase [Rhodothermales bacterium]|jgi:phosphopantothenoylcysteine decarboxylase/phosphopantothenate--cysteine ligase
MPDSPTILIGVCGGIAAYKVASVTSALKKADCAVHVAMTQAAQEFVRPITFSALSGHPVLSDAFPQAASGRENYPHLYPATEAGAFILAPATANSIAKIANGIGDELVSTCALSLPPNCARYFCPAMNSEMWAQPSVQANVARLLDLGWIQLGPDSGLLACGVVGPGRMLEPDAITERVLADLRTPQALAGKHVLILSGPTREHLDPVRFISNHSSGRMGSELAQAAVAAGATVDFVSGPVSAEFLPRSPQVTVHSVISADDMLGAAHAVQADIAIFAAAVADFKPAAVHGGKLPKSADSSQLALTPTADIAATIANSVNAPLCIGFALETDDGLAKAQAKAARKNLAAILLNGPDAMGADSGEYTWITASDSFPWGRLSKAVAARRLISHAAALCE